MYPVLAFNEQGKFRIVQFTDIHFRYNTPRSDSVLNLISTIIREEQPDFIIMTGDVVCSEQTQKAWDQVTRPLIESGIPWAVVLGNHDDEYEMTRQQIIHMLSAMPNSLTIDGPADISGHGNYILNIRGSHSDDTKAVLYCLDSHAYSNSDTVHGYGWIKSDQIEWYKKQSKLLTHNNNGNPLPALAFFHIPLPEYKEVLTKPTTIGSNIEYPCSPDINSGMFTAMFEQKDVMGVFVGHDHDDNFIGCLHRICLAYGCKTGLDSYGQLDKGARIIELYEGQRKFDTWIRSINIEPVHFASYPDSFPPDKEKKE